MGRPTQVQILLSRLEAKDIDAEYFHDSATPAQRLEVLLFWVECADNLFETLKKLQRKEK